MALFNVLQPVCIVQMNTNKTICYIFILAPKLQERFDSLALAPIAVYKVSDAMLELQNISPFTFPACPVG